MNMFKRFVLGVLAGLMLSSIIAFTSPEPTQAISRYTNTEQFAACGDTFFGLPAWHKYICSGDELEDIDFAEEPGKIWLIAVAILEILIRLAGTLAFFYIVYAGMRLVTSQGDSQGVADARRGLIGALIGLGISIVTVALINYLGDTFGSTVDQNTLLPNGQADESVIVRIAQIFVTIVGALSVMYGALGAFRYVYGAGDTQQVSQARRTIAYAIVGVIVAILAGAIINFAVGNVEGL